MTKPTLNTNSKPSKQFKSMFDRFNKNNDDKKWTDILSGTWEIELPIGEFLSAPPPSSNEDSSSDKKESAINDPNSVSNRQAPMVQISEDLKVICIPLSTDIANPHIHQNYLSSKSINTNATRIKVEGKDNVIKLVLDTDSSSSTQSTTDESQENNNNANANNNNSSATNEDKEQVVLEGTINTDSFVIRWSDGSSWSKQGVGNEDEEEETATPSHTNESNDSKPAANKEYEQQLSSLRSQLEIAREKEKMAKSQSQATMGQYADLGQQYAKLTTEHEQLQREHSELSGKHSKMSEEFEAMKAKLDEQTAELERVKGDFQFSRQQEQQMKLNKMKKENEEYIKSINLQQESILSLQDQLQTAQRAGRQYTKTIEDLEARMSESEKQKSQAKAALNEMNAKFMSGQTQLDDQKHKEQILNEKHAKEVRLLTEKHHQEIEKLERGFQETLTQNEKKMQELQTLRNNYEKKNASLTKDVKKLIIQLEKQAKSFSANSVSNQINLGDIGDDNEALKKLRDENAQLSEELIRKSQSLVDALRALAEFHQNPQAVTKSITSGLSHAQQYMFQQQQLQHQQQPNINAHGVHIHDNNGYEQKSNDHHNAAQIDHAAKVPSSYKEVSDQLKMSMEQEMKSPGNNPTSPALTARSSASASNNSQQQQQAQQAAAAGQRVVIGATYGPNDISQQIKQQQAMHSKLGRLRNRFGSKMKEQIQRMQQQMQQQQIQRHKSPEQETLNELNAKSVIKETEKVMMITKTKQQLNAQCVELQGLANELSSTIEQKEEILDSLRFANTYLGKRVICLEKLLKMQPGDPIKNQDELIRDAINITPRKDNQEQQQEDEEEDDAQRAGLQLEMNVSRRVNGNANEEDNDDDAVDVKVIESEARNSDTPELSMATMTQTVDERKKQNQNEEGDDDNDGVRVPQHIQVVLNEELNVENVKKEDGITPVAKDVIVEEVEAKSKQEDKDETEEEEEANKDEDRDQEEPAAQQQDEEERLNSKDNDDEVEQEEVEHVHVQKEDTTQKVGDEHDGNAEHARNEQLDIDDDEREEEEEDEQIEQEEEEANEDKNAQSVDVEVNPTDDPSDNEEKEADPEPEIIKQDEQKSKEEEQDKVEQEEEEEEERNDAAMNVVEEEKPNEEETQKAAQQNEADDNDPQLDSSEQEQ